MKKQTRKDLKDIGNLMLSWLVIAFSGLVGLFFTFKINTIVGSFFTATIAVFITLLIWHRP